MEQLHPWISGDCRVAYQKLLCASTFLSTEDLSLQSVLSQISDPYVAARVSLWWGRSLGENNITLPSYPHRSVCVQYRNSCREYISRSQSDFLRVDCEEVVDGTAMFPLTTQTVVLVPIAMTDNSSSASTFFPLALNSSPNLMTHVRDDEVAREYQPSCPVGFVVPDDSGGDIRWVSGSACAEACKAPIWTPFEYNAFELMCRICVVVGMFAGIPFVTTWVVVKEKRKQYLVLCFAVTSTLATASFLPVIFAPFETRYCRSNAVAISATDGVTPCTVQAILLVYSANGMYLSWLCLCVDIYLQLCLKNNRTYLLRRLFVSVIFGLPLVSVLTLLVTGEYGYLSGTMQCFARNQNNFDAYVFTFPSLAICLIGGGLMASVIRKIAESVKKTSAITSSHPESSSKRRISTELRKFCKKFDMLKIPVLFVFILFAATAGVFALRMGQYLDPGTLHANADWTDCIFENYRRAGDDATWRHVCGRFSKHRTNPIIAGYYMLCSAGGSILISSIYIMNPTVLKLWLRILACREIKVQSEFAIRRVSSLISFAFVPGTTFHFDIHTGHQMRQSFVRRISVSSYRVAEAVKFVRDFADRTAHRDVSVFDKLSVIAAIAGRRTSACPNVIHGWEVSCKNPSSTSGARENRVIPFDAVKEEPEEDGADVSSEYKNSIL